ncbi:MAG: GNAT family N-acetyltransferase [Desulfobulbaceae bacterium]|nr:GNAT family N-acetyltransferase [Desulfobulbaceae bacterium]
MDIREASEEDFKAIVRLVPTRDELHRVYPKGTHPFTVEQLRELAAVRKELTVALVNEEIIGFANLYGLAPQQRAFIGNVVIKRTHREQGFGRKLINHMITKAFEKYGLPEVRISVFSENTPALVLYTNLGFKPYSITIRQAPSGRRVALVHMKLGRDAHYARTAAPASTQP